MSLVKSTPVQKFFRGEYIMVSEHVVVSQSQYETQGESYVIIKDTTNCKLKLNSQFSDHITIKSLTTTLILPDMGKIDEEFDEIILHKNSCVELFHSLGSWYVMSSDGVKNS